MAKARIIGEVAVAPITGAIGEKQTKFIKYLVAVRIGGNTTNNPRVAAGGNTESQRISYFGIMAFGKQAEITVSIGQTVEIDGILEISNFQMDATKPAKQAAIITAEHTHILQSNIQHFAKAYNTNGNLVEQDAEVFNASTMNLYSQRIAVNKKVGENNYTSFYKIKFFGERGQKLFDKQFLNKSKVKTVLVDGILSANYTTKEKDGVKKEFFNCEINVGDFQVTAWAKEQQHQNSDSGNSYAAAGNAYAQQNATYPTHEIPEIDIYMVSVALTVLVVAFNF